MHTPLTTPKQKYHALMALVCDGHEAMSGQLAAVRFGRNVNLTWLIDLVRVSLPHYQNPHELLLAATVTLFL